MHPARSPFDLDRLARLARATVRESFAARALAARVLEEERRPLDVDDRAALDRLPTAGTVIVVADASIASAAGRALWRVVRERRPDCLLLAPNPGDRDGTWVVGRAGRDGRGPRLALRADPTRVARRWAAAGGAICVLPGAMGVEPLPAELVRLCRLGAGPLVTAQLVFDRARHAALDLGRPVPAARLERLADAGELLTYVALRLHALRERRRGDRPSVRRLGGRLAPVLRRRERPLAPAVASDLLAAELAEQPLADRLVVHGDLEVWALRQERAPLLVRELGRLREAAFRAVGEGTGRALDLDRFDATYLHLVAWSTTDRAVVGAYRAIGTDEAFAREGLDGLYTQTLFRYDEATLRALGPALELGRSFVRTEYRQTHAPLLALWKGVAAWIARHPRYRYLFGAVSISAEYRPLSQALMVEYLRSHASHTELAASVRSRRPVAARTVRRGARWSSTLDGLEPAGARELSELIAEIERDGKGVPTLLREYLKLGGRILDFNVDADFSDVIDALLVVDLLATDPRVVRRYFAPETLAHLRALHGPTAHGAARSG